MEKLWGIDLGGTKIECVVLASSTQPDVIIRKRLPTESQKGYQHVLSQISSLVELTAKELGEDPAVVGMGTPGSIDPKTGRLKNSNSVVLNNQPFLQDVTSALGVKVKIANDANCFALAEARMGVVFEKYADASVVFGVIMGTGVGGGIVVNGRIINGHHGIGGEWGHNFLDISGGPCYCGKTGCVETIISGTGLEKFYAGLKGGKKKLRDISQDSISGTDAIATQTLSRLVHFFGLGLSSIVNILDPDVIVIGGGVGNLDILYTEGVKEVEKHVFNNSFNTVITRPTLGDSAGVFGAAFLTI